MTDWQKKNKNRLFIRNKLKTINHKLTNTNRHGTMYKHMTR